MTATISFYYQGRLVKQQVSCLNGSSAVNTMFLRYPTLRRSKCQIINVITHSAQIIKSPSQNYLS